MRLRSTAIGLVAVMLLGASAPAASSVIQQMLLAALSRRCADERNSGIDQRALPNTTQGFCSRFHKRDAKRTWSATKGNSRHSGREKTNGHESLEIAPKSC